MLGLVGLIGASGFFSGIVEPRTFIKVFGSLILPYFYYWYLWLYLGKDVIRGFRIYLKGAQIVSVFGLLIFADSIVSFGFFEFTNSLINIGRVPASFGIRIAGTLGEPTYFCEYDCACWILCHAAASSSEKRNLALRLKEHGLWMTRYAAALILLAMALTFSAMALTGILVIIILHLLIKRKVQALLITPLVIFALLYAARSIPEINERLEGLQNTSTLAEGDVHGSSAILYNHAVITWENFRRNPFFGTGPRIAPRSHEEIQRFTGHSIVPLCRTKCPGCLEYVSAHRLGTRAVRYPDHSLFSCEQLFRSAANRHRRLGAQDGKFSLSCDHFTSIDAPRKLHFKWLSILCLRLPFRLETIQESQSNKMITR